MRIFNKSQSFDAASLRLFMAMQSGGGVVPDQRRYLIDQVVRRLKLSGVWYKLDAFYIFAAKDSISALINWVNPGTYNATLTNAPTFTADRGYTGNGSNAFVDSNFNPTTASSPKFVQDSACIFARCLNNVAENKALWGDTAAFKSNFYPRLAADGALGRINTIGGNISASSTDSTGFWSVNRPGATDETMYKNGASVGVSINASTGPQNANLTALRCATDFSTYQAASFGFGQSLSAGEHAALRNAELAYMQAVGAA